MSKITDFIGGSPIKSIQRGVWIFAVNAATTIPITSVNVSKSVVIISNKSTYSAGSGYSNVITVGGYISSNTGLSLQAGSAVTISANGVGTCYWQVIEYN